MAFYILHLVDDPIRVLRRICDLLAPGGRLICETPCLGESGIALRWSIALAGKLGPLPKVHCFGIADLEAMICGASGFVSVESRCVDEKQTHLLVVAKRA